MGKYTGGDWNPKTLVEVLGKCRLIVEHHKGILCYMPEEIRIRTTYGQLIIQGSGLNLCCMRRDQLCIMGVIDAVWLQGRDESGSVE